MEWWPPLDSPVGSDYSLFGSFCTFFIFAFYFRRRCEWSVALGITDMTRDTLLLEFSQVRATPIEEPRVPLCLPSRAKRRRNGKPRALSPFFLFFVVLSTYPKKEMDSKELNKEDMKMSRGNRESERGLFFFAAE